MCYTGHWEHFYCFSAWQQLSLRLAANVAHGAFSANHDISADRANRVYLRGNRRGGATHSAMTIGCNRRMRAVQSGGRELTVGARSQA